MSGVSDPSIEYRRLPAVDALLRKPEIAILVGEFGEAALVTAARDAVTTARREISEGGSAPDASEWQQRLHSALLSAHAPSLRPVINATGVILHTNLGRAPLSQASIAAMADAAKGYSNLEFDLAAGERGSRHDHARSLLTRLTGAEDALVVNNNAAAVYLVLMALCAGRQVMISRGQLVEIGGGFRIPDVLRQSGAELVEVGATNRTHLRDFEDALTERSAAILRVHSSNFRQIGFVAMPSLAELAALAHRPRTTGDRLLLIDDLGSGTLLPTADYGLAPEPTVQQSIAAGADLVTFSGDKLLGGPQAGLIVGAAPLVARLRRHPLARALRVDKLTLAALEATLRCYVRGRATEEIPVWQMIALPADAILQQARRWHAKLLQAGVAGEVRPGESAVGGGSLPGETLPTTLLAVTAAQPDRVAETLRLGEPAVVCRIQKDTLLFDPRTVLPHQEASLLDAILAAMRAA